MAAIQRRPLKKAPPMDVVDAFTRQEQSPAPAGADIEQQRPTALPGAQQNADRATPAKQEGAQARELEREGSAVEPRPQERRGPGRPRSKRRMEQLATKIDIELRDQVDSYLAEHGGTLVDLIDEALRAHISRE